jgi:integrase
MTTGARRGEQCGLRWRHVDLEHGALTYDRSISQDNDSTWEMDTKTHQQRRVALDPETVTVLAEHWKRCQARSTLLGTSLTGEEFVFSSASNGRKHLLPSTVTQRYGRLAARLGIKISIHKLRHYSATELIKAGIDIRTVAGRLGHGGGGATTLRVYTAWISEADQRASLSMHARMPARPTATDGVERILANPESPYELIAVQLFSQIASGDLQEPQPQNSLILLRELVQDLLHLNGTLADLRGLLLGRRWVTRLGLLGADHTQPWHASNPIRRSTGHNSQ